MMRTVSLVLLVTLWAQQPPAPPGPDSTGVIAGRITESGSGTPLPHTVVRLIDATGRFVTVTTDGEGRYTFPRLTAGRYRVVAGPGEFVASHTSRLYEGERTPPTNVIVLEKDQQRTDVNVALPRAYAISGTVLDPEGEPAARVEIEVERLGGGDRVNRSTDDRGEFRIFGLEPGEYVVCARPDTSVDGQRSRDRSRPRLVETCSPSAASSADATPVTIRNSDLEGIDVRLLSSRTFSISGVVVGADGTPAAGASTSLTRFESHTSSSTGDAAVDPAGRFTFRNLIPGDYAIRAQFGQPGPGFEHDVREIAYARVTIGTRDVEGFVLTMVKTVGVRGHFTFADQGAPAEDLYKSLFLDARLEGADPRSSEAGVSGTANSDLTFELGGLFGKRILVVAEPVRDWIVKAIRYRGRDILDVPTDFSPIDDPRDLEIVLTNRGGIVSGSVTDAAGRPANARVLLVPADRSRWSSIRRPESTMFPGIGQFRLGPERPGDYAIVAVDPAFMPSELQDERFFEWILRAGQPVTLTENDRRTVDLRITKLPQER